MKVAKLARGILILIHALYLSAGGTEAADGAAFCFPTDGYVGYIYDQPDITGRLHKGIDIWTRRDGGPTHNKGNPIYLPYEGKLVGFFWEDGIKQGLRFQHQIDPSYPDIPVRRVETRYFHMANEYTGESYVDSGLTIGVTYPRGTFLGYQGNQRYRDKGSIITHLHIGVVDIEDHTPSENFFVDPSLYFGFDFSYPSSDFGWKDSISRTCGGETC